MPQPSIADDPQLEERVRQYVAGEDPYSSAVAVIATALETVLWGEVSGSMSDREYRVMEQLAFRLLDIDPAARIHIDPQPKGG